jgi:hypothetical protein
MSLLALFTDDELKILAVLREGLLMPDSDSGDEVSQEDGE